jgi:hypothetical protein
MVGTGRDGRVRAGIGIPGLALTRSSLLTACSTAHSDGVFIRRGWFTGRLIYTADTIVSVRHITPLLSPGGDATSTAQPIGRRFTAIPADGLSMDLLRAVGSTGDLAAAN